MDKRQQELRRFDAFCATLHKDYRFDTYWCGPDILHLAGVNQKLTGALMAATHGNEPGGVRALADFLENILMSGKVPSPNLFFILCNRDAYNANKRCIECDLNRQYGSSASSRHEEKRAQELKKVLSKSDFSLDIHQTVELSSKSFFIVPEGGRSLPLCNLVDLSLPSLVSSFSTSVTTSSSYMASLGRPGITLELRGGTGFDEKARQTCRGIFDKVSVLTKLPKQEVGSPSNRFKIEYTEPYYKGKVFFRTGLQTFDTVQAGEQVGENNGAPLLSPVAGPIILYPSCMLSPDLEPIGTYFILKELITSKKDISL